MNSFTYLLIGYAFGALAGGFGAMIATRIHYKQHGVKRT
jgi:hypothetical protein